MNRENFVGNDWQAAQHTDEMMRLAEIERASARIYDAIKDRNLVPEWALLTHEAGADPETVKRQITNEEEAA